ncbi:MAG: hypothetical protein J5752_02140 [Clostridiales bacterium]|nr:hypothetical protein [Clostridiales bacterium]
MKRQVILAMLIMLSGTVLLGCEKKEDETSGASSAEETTSIEETTTTTTYEAQHKTENETVHVSKGIIPQVIEKKVTYVQTEKDGPWDVESYEVLNWGWEDSFVILNTVWYVESSDACALYSGLDESYSGKKASMYLHFKDDLEDCRPAIGKDADGTPKMDLTLKITANAILECDGEKRYLGDFKVYSAEVYEDGTSKTNVENAEGKWVILGTPDVKAATWEDFCAAAPSAEDILMAQSITYISDISFSEVPGFAVKSGDLKDGRWDPKITNTKFRENLSPDLSWDRVEGASRYAVFMIDGEWLHMDVFTTETALAEGAFGRGERGAQYVGPYPPWGTHTYSVFVFALKGESGEVPFEFDGGGNDINKIYAALDVDKDGNAGNVVAYGRLDGNYTHQD